MRSKPLFLAALLLWPSPLLAQVATAPAGGLSNARLVLASLAAAGLAVAAVWSCFNWFRTRSLAATAEDWALRLRGLLATAPGGYLLLTRTGEVTCSEAVRAWLGLAQEVTDLSALNADGNGGIAQDDFRQLKRDLDATSAAGTPFNRLVRNAAGTRVLLAQGRALPTAVAGEGGVVVWFADATEARTAIERMETDVARLSRELESASALLEAAPIPIWSRDRDFNLVHVNSAYVAAVESAQADEVVKRGTELVGNPLSPAPRRAAEQALATGQIQSREEPVVIAGQRRMMRIIDVPLGAHGVGGYGIDVTEREQIRVEFERFASAQTKTLDMLSTAVVVFGPDKHIIFHNSAFGKQFELDPLWLATKPHHGELLDRLRAARRIPEPENFAAWKRAALAQYTETLRPVEEMWHLADGTALRVVTQPHPFGGLQILFEDHSERMGLERSYNTLIKVQQATLDNLQEGVAVFGPEGQLRLSNSEFASVWRLDGELLARRPHIEEVVAACRPRFDDPAGADAIRAMVLAVSASRRIQTCSVELTDGLALRAAGVPLPDGNVLITWSDVTAQNRVENALRERADAFEAADRLKSEFVANMSYELRVPLNVITGFGEMMASGLAGPLSERQHGYVEDIRASAHKLELLINDILDLAAIEAGELSLDLAPVDAHEATASVLTLVEDQARRAGITVIQQLDASLGAIDADERRFKSVLFKLLNNAITFTPGGGAITVSGSGTSEAVSIAVRDTGVGISADLLPHVFEKFRKGANTRGTGVGLGLSLVKSFVEQHGGSVQVASREGEGTTVTFSLPRIQPDARTRAA